MIQSSLPYFNSVQCQNEMTRRSQESTQRVFQPCIKLALILDHGMKKSINGVDERGPMVDYTCSCLWENITPLTNERRSLMSIWIQAYWIGLGDVKRENLFLMKGLQLQKHKIWRSSDIPFEKIFIPMLSHSQFTI